MFEWHIHPHCWKVEFLKYVFIFVINVKFLDMLLLLLLLLKILILNVQQFCIFCCRKLIKVIIPEEETKIMNTIIHMWQII